MNARSNADLHLRARSRARACMCVRERKNGVIDDCRGRGFTIDANRWKSSGGSYERASTRCYFCDIKEHHNL
jgi:hypothetical protein